MEPYQLIEYRPKRWVKVDPETGAIGPATSQEVAAWLAAQKAAQSEAPPLAQADAGPPPEVEKPAQPIPTTPVEADPRGAPQKPSPKPKPEEPTKPREAGPVRPLAGRRRITSTFADHQNRTPPSTAPGIDFACPVGTEVRVWAAGRVVRSRWSDGGGRALWVEHVKGIRTYYAHLDSVSALEGETVTAGQKIGESGTTGHSTGPHLHFSVMRNGQYIDPEPHLPPEDNGTV
jgi:murein DD-endopeptidase MepM/ murein hydrolase activator NlpD